MEDISSADDALAQVAAHEAGHAVAACVRGWTQFGDLSLQERGGRLGADVDWAQVPEASRPFVAYAGPWAQARALWDVRTGEDVNGLVFDDYVVRAMNEHPHDSLIVALAEFELATLLRDGGAGDDGAWRWLRGVFFAWRGELEDLRPVIERVAARLAAGDRVHADDIRRMADDRLAALYC